MKTAFRARASALFTLLHLMKYFYLDGAETDFFRIKILYQ